MAGSVELLKATHRPHELGLQLPPMSNIEDPHSRWRLTSHYIECAGRSAVPASGEIHFSRLPRSRWDDRLRLIKAAGITVAACYVFWIHHERSEGEARFDGNVKVAAFVRLCDSLGLDVVLRIGPWAHGEVRNGGFPDWVQAAAVEHRTNDPAYLALAERLPAASTFRGGGSPVDAKGSDRRQDGNLVGGNSARLAADIALKAGQTESPRAPAEPRTGGEAIGGPP